MSTPVPYDASPRRPPAPKSLTSFLLTSSATAANDSSVRAGATNRSSTAIGDRRKERKSIRFIGLISEATSEQAIENGELKNENCKLRTEAASSHYPGR